jgi:hypothetical protein
MADYRPLIARAVAGLDNNTGQVRRTLYERARTALVTQLHRVQPVLEETEITREQVALEQAIRKVEADATRGILASLAKIQDPRLTDPLEELATGAVRPEPKNYTLKTGTGHYGAIPPPNIPDAPA